MNELRPKNESLARYYRPKVFEEIVGQESIIKILKKQYDLSEFKNVYLFCGSSGCVDGQTEYFNGKEWKPISQYTPTEKVLVYHPDDSTTLEHPENYIVEDCNEMNYFHTKYGLDMCISDEHTVIYTTQSGNLKSIPCFQLINRIRNNTTPTKLKLKTTFTYNGQGMNLTDDELRLMVAVIADGYFDKYGNCIIGVKKHRKITRLTTLLSNANICYRTYTSKKDYTVFYFNAPRKEKEYTSDWYNCSNHQLQIICDEVMNWDGNFNTKNKFYSYNKKSLDFIQFAFSACGYRAKIILNTTLSRDFTYTTKTNEIKTYHYEPHSDTGDTVLITLKNKPEIGLPINKDGIVRVTPEGNKKYCFTTSTGMWVMRRNGCILITGNCGKTTTARAFANLINGSNKGIIEIDAASNNGVDNVRELVKTASERSVDSTYKIIILDECHLLTNQAWSAFLKCIEEPPKYTIFMFCTTDPQKIPTTILNRVMRFNFTKIPTQLIEKRLIDICVLEHYTNFSEACNYISKICNGQMRDGIALLDKCASYNEDLSINNVFYALGDYSYDNYLNLINNIIDGNTNSVLTQLDKIYNTGNDLKLFIEKFLDFCLDIAKYIICNDISVTKFPVTWEENVKNCINFAQADSYYVYIINSLLNLKNDLKTDTNPYTSIQVTFIKLCRCQ